MARRRLGRQEPPEQLDPYEQAVLRHAEADPTLTGGDEPPAYPWRISTRTLLVFFAVVAGGVLLVKVGGGDRVPKVGGSCTSPAYALDRTHVKQYGAIAWAATGSAASTVVLGVDTSTVPVDRDHGRLFPQVPLTGCKAHGRFGVLVPPGEHVVTAFVVAPDGTGTAIGSTKVKVDPQ